MNMISTILCKENINAESALNIVWTPCDNNNFLLYIQNMGHRIYQYEHLYFGSVSPNLIICNNKMYSHQQVKSVSLNYHLPVLVVDHKIKDESVDLQTALKTIDNFNCCYKIALNNKIYDSWGRTHNEVLHFNEDNIQLWKNILYNLAKRTFTL